MPYISTEEVREKRKMIRKELKDYKISVTGDNYSTIRVGIKSGPIDLMKNCEEQDKKSGYEQVNHFHYEKHNEDFPEKVELLDKIMKIVNYNNYIASVDGDYGNIPSFYVSIRIGNWDSPYVVTS